MTRLHLQQIVRLGTRCMRRCPSSSQNSAQGMQRSLNSGLMTPYIYLECKAGKKPARDCFGKIRPGIPSNPRRSALQSTGLPSTQHTSCQYLLGASQRCMPSRTRSHSLQCGRSDRLHRPWPLVCQRRCSLRMPCTQAVLQGCWPCLGCMVGTMLGPVPFDGSLAGTGRTRWRLRRPQHGTARPHIGRSHCRTPPRCSSRKLRCQFSAHASR